MLSDLPIRYALFDMDGTLTDTMCFWRNATNEFLAEEGLSLSGNDVRILEKKTFYAGVEYIRSLHLSPRADTFGLHDVLRILKAHYETDAVAKPDAKTLLDSLRARGVKMGVATLTPSPLAEICLTRTGLRAYFDFILGGESYPEGKTAPRIFLDAACSFACAPKEMYLFEDSLYSIKTAVSLGIPIIGVADKYQEDERGAIIDASVAFFENGFARRVK
ncbi:MAG: HAD family phosphatase [Ruminococcaceae bacterium]|nr:HAD family phosphatase [Oscillospiraceae bacterium]